MSVITEDLRSVERESAGDLPSSLRHIVERALSWEEGGVYFRPKANATPSAEAEAIMARWQRLLTLAGGEDAFEKRLGQLGWTMEEALQRFDPVHLPDDAPLPEWAVVLADALTLAQEQDEEARAAMQTAGALCRALLTRYEREMIRPEQTWVALEKLLRPFVAWALRTLQLHPVWTDCLSQTAKEELAVALLGRLSVHCTRTVAYEMKHARVRGELWGATAEDRYRSYIDDILPSRREDLLSRYPVLGRLLAVVTIFFERSCMEFLDRFEADQAKLQRFLGIQNPLMITHAACFLSDPHDGGRTVWHVDVLGEGRDVPLYYKPRSLGVDVAWANLLKWLSDRGLEPSLQAAAVIDKGEYGWSRGIEAADCKDDDEVKLYMRRQGAISALLVALAGQDFHPENFIASGSMPVAVDLEGLLAAIISTRHDTLADLPHTAVPLVFTAAGNLMLPYFRAGEPDEPLFFASGICGTGARRWPVRSPRWMNPNTDQLTLSMQWVELHYNNSVPTLQGKKIEGTRYRNEIVQGIEDTFRLLEKHWSTLLAEDGPFGAFRGLSSRTVFRDTQEYIDLLFWTTAPDILRSGAAYDVALEVLAVRPPVFCNGAEFPDLAQKEKEALWRRDIPIAVTPNDETSLRMEDGTRFGPTVPISAWDQLGQRAADWSSTETAWQTAIARSMLTFTEEREPLPAHDLLSAATAIGDLLIETAVTFDDEVAWLTLVRGVNSQRVYPFQASAWDGNGTAGVALFLAELARVTGEERFRQWSLRAFASIERTIRKMRESQWTDSVGLSGFNGIFALLYCLARASVALGEESLLEIAISIVAEIKDEELLADDVPDFMLGHAGALAVLAELHKHRPSELLRHKAQLCAKIIADAARDQGASGWKVRHFERPLLGMGHGSSGIAVGLLLAEDLLGREVMGEVRAALTHERQHFDAEQKRWPNLQRRDGHSMHGWCAGQAGIAFARLSMLRFAGDRLGEERPLVEAELQTAIDASVAELHTGRQHMCCGDAGVICLLSTAGRALNRPDLVTAAQAEALAMLERARDQKLWRFQEFTERMPIPGLLNGLCGVGLSLLTAIDPHTSEFLTLC